MVKGKETGLKILMAPSPNELEKKCIVCLQNKLGEKEILSIQYSSMKAEDVTVFSKKTGLVFSALITYKK